MLTDGRPASSKKSNVNYERLGKAVEDALILDYIYILHSTKRQVWSSFVRGVFAGIGGVLGATVGIALLVGILEVFGGAPVIGKYVQGLTNTIEHGPAVPTPAPTAKPTPPRAATPTPAPATPTPTAAPTATPVPTATP
jgi:hypothetical protein